MAKRELSSLLMNLKFMQRATQQEEKVKKEEEEEVKPAPATQLRKCVVVMEGDPIPGEIKGRLSFGGFNPLIDKLNNPGEPAAPVSSCGIQSERETNRENGSSVDEAECSNTDNSNCEPNGDHKRKQSEVVSETQYLDKLPKNDQGQSSPHKSKGSFKKPKGGKLDYNILRSSKSQTKRDGSNRANSKAWSCTLQIQKPGVVPCKFKSFSGTGAYCIGWVSSKRMQCIRSFHPYKIHLPSSLTTKSSCFGKFRTSHRTKDVDHALESIHIAGTLG